MTKELLEHLIKPIVDYPDEVQITEFKGQSVCIYELHTNPADFG